MVNSKIKNNSSSISGIINDLKDNNVLSYESNIKIYSEFTRAFLYSLGFSWPIIDNNYIKNLLLNLDLI